jgi:putative transcriptional regulator
MGNTFKSIARGLNEAVAHANGKKVAVKTYKPESVDVSALHLRMDIIQEQFAARFGFLLRRYVIGSVEIARHRARHWCC